MTTIINFGSCTIDRVFQVPHFVHPGETLPSTGFRIHGGGKGLNQSLAIARAGGRVKHAGRIGPDGDWLRKLLDEAGADTSLIETGEDATGQAIIQVTPDGENAIVICAGANGHITSEHIRRAFTHARPGELLLVQNEVNRLDEIIDVAQARGLRIAFNMAPMTEDALSLPLSRVEFFVVNRTEGEALTGEQSPGAILDAMVDRFPHSRTILTLGSEGAIYGDADSRLAQPAFKVSPVDSTGAGDTFIGYFLAALANGREIWDCLEWACRAAAICVTRAGAASSIPTREEVDQACE